jgi:hypothetical protein
MVFDRGDSKRQSALFRHRIMRAIELQVSGCHSIHFNLLLPTCRQVLVDNCSAENARLVQQLLQLREELVSASKI